MEICSVKEEYIKYLQKFDNRVCISKLDKAFGRKYIGVIFEIKDFTYFAPLSSSVYKIINGEKVFKQHFTDVYLFNKKTPIASVKLNNMIPIPREKESELIQQVIISKFLNSNIEANVKYGNLLKVQREEINSETKKKEILDKATSFYKTYRFNPKLQRLCCDFQLLEQKALEFSLDIFKDLNKEFKLEKKKEKTIEQEEELVR